ncbi:DUF983 domain-containing protein [Pseudaminobacter sp. 19-2017]|uniref:DUF983 domain-containing protein n=1 Tax=Pseudaminobacter soli (ex Zhang et al. 2022) TaxID=2831468 RepID=A0A942E6G9_9HYPH|nr:DUF983 domain-containing protein [Pseudaminobacter soli]MBS3651390.1 DUF983 domain-containing protein [Pseudaminobacter soli]
MEEQVFGGEHHSGRPARSLGTAMKRGMLGCCPNCGKGRLFRSFLKIVDHCEVCGEAMHHHRADDLPAYLVVVILGHIIVAAAMTVEQSTTLSLPQHLAIWIPLTIVLCVAMLRPVKGAVVGLQWALYMHGFSGRADALDSHPEIEHR